jgi:branched-chain amino acid aminotransferase
VATRVYIDGRIHDEASAVVPVFDRGFLYGDGVYDVLRTAGGRPVDLPRHLERLRRSAAAVGIATPELGELAHVVEETLAAAANEDSYVRIIVTRGDGELGLDPALADRPRIVVIVKPLRLPAAELYRTGVEVALVEVRRTSRRALDPAIKSGNYLNNILALAEARRVAAHESIMLNPDGYVAEGSTSNIFLVADGQLRTPALDDGLLAGITRRRVLELALEADLPCVEAHVVANDLRDASELFLTSSLRGILPATRLDGRPVGAGVPGPITLELMRRYDAFLAEAGAAT